MTSPFLTEQLNKEAKPPAAYPLCFLFGLRVAQRTGGEKEDMERPLCSLIQLLLASLSVFLSSTCAGHHPAFFVFFCVPPPSSFSLGGGSTGIKSSPQVGKHSVFCCCWRVREVTRAHLCIHLLFVSSHTHPHTLSPCLLFISFVVLL